MNVTGAAWLALGLSPQLFCQTANRVRPDFRTAPRSLIVTSVDVSRAAIAPGAVHPEVQGAADLGAVEPNMVLDHLQLVLRRTPERQAAFDAEVEALHHHGDPSYRQWLTPETIGSEFGPSPTDLAAVVGYLQGQGFTIDFTGKSGLTVDFRGTAAQVLHSFGTPVHSYRLAGGELRYSASREATIPEALSPLVIGFAPIANIGPHSQVHKAVPPLVPHLPGSPKADAGSLQPDYTVSSTEYQVGPQDFYTIYDETPLLSATNPIDGNGITIVLLEQSDIDTADVTAFRTMFNVLPNAANLTVLHGYGSVACSAPGKTGDEVEAVLDAEWAGAVAPAATLDFLSCPNVFTAAQAAVDGNLGSILSLSYGTAETGESTYGAEVDSLWEQAAAQGQTVIVSAGDSGSSGAADQNKPIATHGTVGNLYASTAYNVAAGGTDFQDTYNYAQGSSFGPSMYWNSTNGTGDSSAKSYVPETTWNLTCASALISYYYEQSTNPAALCDDTTYGPSFKATSGAGGGVSILHQRPSWQNGTVYGLPAATGIYNARLLPDISLFASPGYWWHALSYYQSDVSTGLLSAGGTSFVAPQLAGVFALISQQTGSLLGQPNYELYSLAGTAFGTTSFTGASCNGSGASGVGTTTSAPDASCIFHDIQTGNNSQACAPGSPNCYNDPGATIGLLSTSLTSAQPAYQTGPGYDLATGIGSLDIDNLVKAWVNPTVTPQAASVALTLNPTALPYGTTAANFIVTASGTNQGFSPNGTATYGTGGTQFPLTDEGCSGGTCSAQLTLGLTLPVHPPNTGFNFSTVYTPTANNRYYTGGSASATLPVVKQTPATAPATAVFMVGTASETLSAQVSYTGSGSAPTGSVGFQVDAGTISTGSCSGSSSPLTCSVAYNTSALAAGSHTLHATYAGDANYNPAPGTATLLVEPAGSVWTANGNSSLSEFYLTGAVDSSSAFTGGGLGAIATPLGIAFDASGNAWVASSNGVSEFNMAGSAVRASASTAGGVGNPASVAIDGDGNVWVANGNGTLSELSNAGAALSPAAGYSTAGTSALGPLAVDLSGNVWTASPSAHTVTEVIGLAAPTAPLAKALTLGKTGQKP